LFTQNLIFMAVSLSITQDELQRWVAEKTDLKTVETLLAEKGLSPEHIGEQLKSYRKLLIEQRQCNGFICLGIGAVLGFISCVLTLINPVPALYGVILYGLTSVAILIIMVGFYYLFE